MHRTSSGFPAHSEEEPPHRGQGGPSPHLCHLTSCHFPPTQLWPHTPASGPLLYLLHLPVIILPQIFPLLILSFQVSSQMSGYRRGHSQPPTLMLFLPLLCYTGLLALTPPKNSTFLLLVCTQLPECKLHEGKGWFFFIP